MEAAVPDTLPTSVLLETDVEELGELLGGSMLKRGAGQQNKAVVVTICAQEGREAVKLWKKLESGTQVKPIT